MSCMIVGHKRVTATFLQTFRQAVSIYVLLYLIAHMNIIKWRAELIEIDKVLPAVPHCAVFVM